jgi:uncharacterized membrane protein YkgB
MLDPLIVEAISIGLGLMFIVAAYHKLNDNTQFRVTLIEYQLLPEALVKPASRIIPIVEMLLGGSWLFSFYQSSVTAIASCTLLGIYAAAVGINIYRGRVHFDCGCGFGRRSGQEQFLSGGLVLRNIVLIAAALLTLAPTGTRAIGFGDYLALAATLLVLALLFAAANQLLRNRAAINTWRSGK